MSLLQINTAIPLAEPLLEEREAQVRSERRLANNDRGYRTKFVFLGILTGFLIQVVSLGAYTFLLLSSQGQLSNDDIHISAFANSGMFRNGSGLDESAKNNDTIVDNKTIPYTILSVLTQIDLIVYVIIWVAFTCTMTRNGLACIRSQFFERQNFEDNKKVIKRRYIFMLGVYFLVGIVLGAFGAWSSIDLYFGFPIPFEPILTTVAIDLLLCYLMVWCYDLGGKKKRRSKEKADRQETEIMFSNYDSDDDDDEEIAMCC